MTIRKLSLYQRKIAACVVHLLFLALAFIGVGIM